MCFEKLHGQKRNFLSAPHAGEVPPEAVRKFAVHRVSLVLPAKYFERKGFGGIGIRKYSGFERFGGRQVGLDYVSLYLYKDRRCA